LNNTDSFSTIRETARRLNEAVDDLNSVIKAFERQLINSHIGIECWLNDEDCHLTETDLKEDGESGPRFIATILGFARVSDPEARWRLAIKTQSWRSDAEGKSVCVERDPTPLVDASRTARLNAVGLFDLLREQLIAEGESFLDDINEAMKDLRAGKNIRGVIAFE